MALESPHYTLPTLHWLGMRSDWLTRHAPDSIVQVCV